MVARARKAAGAGSVVRPKEFDPMRRSLAAAFLLAVALTAGPRLALAQSTPDAAAADINAYWARQFAAAGDPYVAPAVVDIADATQTKCGTITPQIGPGAYCGADNTIYLVPAYFNAADPASAFAFDTVLAHEWGHAVQRNLGIGGTSQQLELQADCLGGAYLRDAASRGLFSQEMLTQSVGLAAQSGDLSFVPDQGEEHGSGADRGISMMQGYQGGPQACGVL